MHHDENWGEYCDDNDAFVRVYNNLLLHECIYYFTPVHFLTCCLPFFLHCVSKKHHRCFSYNSRKHCRIFI